MGKTKNYKSYFSLGTEIPRRTRIRIKKRLGRDQCRRDISGLDSLPLLQIRQLNENAVGTVNATEQEHDNDPLESENLDKETPIFNGSQVTKSELVILLFGLMMKHQLTRDAMNDVMKILTQIIPCATDFPKSFLQLLKVIPSDTNHSSINYYCPACEGNIHINELENNCKMCNFKCSKLLMESTSSFYVMFNVRDSISTILQDPSVASELSMTMNSRSTDNEFYRDITDGDAYKGLNLCPSDITCSMNTDGVALFKSSKSSLWPILLSINELNYKTRCSNTFVGGLWVGSKKPKFDAFFETFSNQCCDLSASGVSWNSNEKTITSKVYFPIMVCDSVARCLCQGIHQFNGRFGCTWCLNEGKSLLYGESSRKWIYEGVSYTPRDHFQFLGHIEELCSKLGVKKNTNVSHFGITTASQLLSIPKFNIVTGFTYDSMHSAFLGISKSMLTWWTSSEFHDRPFYIGRKMKEVDQKLLSFMVPYCFDRAVRSITLFKFWKASEWRTWTYVALIVLKNILPDPYLKHFSYFVEAIMILLGSAIHKSEVARCDDLIKLFVEGMPTLYGPEFCLYNFHIILHAPSCVKNWGPLWCYSAFQFENCNGS